MTELNKQMWYSFWWHLGTCTWPPWLADQISPALTSQRTQLGSSLPSLRY